MQLAPPAAYRPRSPFALAATVPFTVETVSVKIIDDTRNQLLCFAEEFFAQYSVHVMSTHTTPCRWNTNSNYD